MNRLTTFRPVLVKTSGDVYLILISIVQGVILGYFFKILGEPIKFNSYNWVFAFITLLIIILVWHEYVNGMSIFGWVLTVVDSIIPFLMGIAEWLLISKINDAEGDKFFFYLFVLMIIACIPYANMLKQAKKEPDNEKIFKIISPYIISSMVCIFVASLIFLFFFLASSLLKTSYLSCSLFSVLIMLFITLKIRSHRIVLLNYYDKINNYLKIWNELITNYPYDEDIHILHALRLGLLAKVDEGNITEHQSLEIFKKTKELILSKKNR